MRAKLFNFFVAGAAIIAGAVACSGDNAATPETNDTAKIADAIYTGAKIYTADPDNPWADSFAVKGDQFVYVGDADGAEAYADENSTRYDLSGKMVLPGLIDSHVHPGFIAQFSAIHPLPEAENQEDQLADIRALLEANADDDIFHGIGWDNRFFGTDGPTRQMLDAMDDTRPVIIHDITMHSIWVNTKALEASGIGPDPEDPVPGVAYHKRDENGDLTGYITESAATQFVGNFVSIGDKERSALMAFLGDLSESGITTVFDAGNFGADDKIYKLVSELHAEGLLPVRYHGAYALFVPNQYETAIAELKAIGDAYNSDMVSIDTLKIFLDGVVETRGAHMIADYDDTPGNRGGALLTGDQLRQLAIDVDREGLHLHVHVIGDQAARSTLDAIEAAREELGRPLNIRVAATHLQVVDPADYPRFAELDVIGQFTPAWHGFDIPFYGTALGDRANHPYPAAALMEHGATLSFSSDVYFPSEWHDGSANPFTGMQVGHTRQYRSVDPRGPISGPESEKLPRNVLVDGYTMGGAKQLAVEARLGSLEAGKTADFIILGEDLFEIDAQQIHQIVPEAVFLNGALVQGSIAQESVSAQ